MQSCKYAMIVLFRAFVVITLQFSDNHSVLVLDDKYFDKYSSFFFNGIYPSHRAIFLKRMEVSTVLSIIFVNLFCFVSSTRHVVYWDRDLIPKLSATGLEIRLEVDDYMDILCPFANHLEDAEGSRHRSVYLQLFNVTRSDYMNCNTENGIRLQNCDDPEIEKKLTTKFQERSPNPFGFTFIPGATYYYLSKPIGDSREGCTEDTMKMMIHVERKGTVHDGKDNERTRTYHVTGSKDHRRGPSVVSHKDKSNSRPHRHHHHEKEKTTRQPKINSYKYETQSSKKVYSPRMSAVRNDNSGNGGSTINRHYSSSLIVSFALYVLLKYFLCNINELQ